MDILIIIILLVVVIVICLCCSSSSAGFIFLQSSKPATAPKAVPASNNTSNSKKNDPDPDSNSTSPPPTSPPPTSAGPSSGSTTSNQCPTSNSAPCPAGTTACVNNPAYCYDPAKDQMVSTYFVSAYDNCPSDLTSTKTNKPYKIAGVNVWPRISGVDMTCTNIDNPKCPTGRSNCPAGTQHCAGGGDAHQGYCYDGNKNQMVSTYFVSAYDKCSSDPTSTKTNLSYQIAGVNVWPRTGGKDKQTCPNIV